MRIPGVRMAFKEWRVVVDALARGEQILLLRKGGIAEPRGGFRVEHNEFLLFPTRFHQQREGVLGSAQARFDLLMQEDPGREAEVCIAYWARVVAWRKIHTMEQALALEGQHIWKPEVIRERFDWGRESAIHAMALRIFRMPTPVVLPMEAAYGGCKSWIELGRDLAVDGSEAVLQDAVFETRLRAFEAVLGTQEKSEQT